MAMLTTAVQPSAVVCRALVLVSTFATSGFAEEMSPYKGPEKEITDIPRMQTSMDEQGSTLWRYGAYLDLSYPIDFNFPDNRRWRSKVTTQRVNELTPNMIMGYIRKNTDESSRWGMEFGVQGGYDVTGQVPNASLRHGNPYSDAKTFSKRQFQLYAKLSSGLFAVLHVWSIR